MKTQIITETASGTNVKSILKACMLLSAIISVVLYIGFRILFNEFETTVQDELFLFARLSLGSVLVVLTTAGIAAAVRLAAVWFARNKKKTEVAS